MQSNPITVALGNDATPVVYTDVNELIDINLPEEKTDTYESTPITSTSGMKEYKAGLSEMSEFDFNLWWDETDTTHASLRAVKDAKSIAKLKLTMANGTYMTINAYVTNLKPEGKAGVDLKMNVKVRPTGATVLHLPVAPSGE